LQSDRASSSNNNAPWLIKPRSGRFVLLVAIFIGLAALAASGVTSGPEDATAKYFKSIEGSRGLDYAMIIIAAFGDITALVLLGIVLTVIRRTRKAGMIFLIAIVSVAILVMYIKPVVGRQIPPYSYVPSMKLPDGAIEPDSLAPFAENLSFPSGHIAAATSLAFIVGYAAYRKYPKVAYGLWAFPVISSVARLYLLQHYPTDVIAGIVLGLAVSIFLSSLMKLEVPFAMSQLKGPGGGAVTDNAPR
jgi:undecaprenyl-diphosphatase